MPGGLQEAAIIAPYLARIAELEAALKRLLAAIDEKSDDERETLAEFEKFAAVVRAARAALDGEKDD